MDTEADRLTQPWKLFEDSFSKRRAHDKDTIFYGSTVGEKMTIPGSAGEVSLSILYDTSDEADNLNHHGAEEIAASHD